MSGNPVPSPAPTPTEETTFSEMLLAHPYFAKCVHVPDATPLLPKDWAEMLCDVADGYNRQCGAAEEDEEELSTRDVKALAAAIESGAVVIVPASAPAPTPGTRTEETEAQAERAGESAVQAFTYLLNAMERAAQSGAPHANGYGDRRAAVLGFVRGLAKGGVYASARTPEAP